MWRDVKDEKMSSGQLSLRHALASKGEIVGTFLNLGSPLVTEVVAASGFDWVLVDLEHGAGDEAMLIGHFHAANLHGVSAIVRVEAGDRMRCARALDFGAQGIMLPRIRTAEEVREALSLMRYPPAGTRGVSLMARANRFGAPSSTPLDAVNDAILCFAQIETLEAVACVEEIAEVDGVDVLFLGPTDLSHAMGRPGRTDDELFENAAQRIASAARNSGKAAGVLVRHVDQVKKYRTMGFQVFAVGSDSAMLAEAASRTAAWFHVEPAALLGAG